MASEKLSPQQEMHSTSCKLADCQTEAAGLQFNIGKLKNLIVL